MFTTAENRRLTAGVFGWLSVAAGALASLALIAAFLFRALQGLDRQSDSGLTLASGLALLALVVGVPCGGYCWFLGRPRLACIALVFSVVPLAASFVLGRFYPAPY